MRSLFQYSLRFGLFLLTMASVFMATVRVTDLATALVYFVFFTWLLSPLLAAFAVLYLQTRVPPRPRTAGESRAGKEAAGRRREFDTE